jgi:hypothetical protein
LVNRIHRWDILSISSTCIFVLCAVGFIFREKSTTQPMLHLGLFSNRLFSLANLSALLNFMSQYSFNLPITARLWAMLPNPISV